MSFWGAAFSALGSSLLGGGSGSSSRDARRTAQMNQRLEEMRAANARRLAEWERGNELEDRRYRQESFGNYAQFNRTPGIVRPELSSTTPTPIAPIEAIPENERRRNNNNGLLYFRG